MGVPARASGAAGALRGVVRAQDDDESVKAARRVALGGQLQEVAGKIDETHAAIAALGARGADETMRLDELRGRLAQAAAQNKRQLAATLRGVQLLRGPDGPDPKLLSMSQLHMLGEVLAALFDRLHVKDADHAEREDALCAAMRMHKLPLPPEVLLPSGEAANGDARGEPAATPRT